MLVAHRPRSHGRAGGGVRFELPVVLQGVAVEVLEQDPACAIRLPLEESTLEVMSLSTATARTAAGSPRQPGRWP